MLVVPLVMLTAELTEFVTSDAKSAQVRNGDAGATIAVEVVSDALVIRGGVEDETAGDALEVVATRRSDSASRLSAFWTSLHLYSDSVWMSTPTPSFLIISRRVPIDLMELRS